MNIYMNDEHVYEGTMPRASHDAHIAAANGSDQSTAEKGNKKKSKCGKNVKWVALLVTLLAMFVAIAACFFLLTKVNAGTGNDYKDQMEEIALLKKALLQSEEKFTVLQEYVNDSRVADLTLHQIEEIPLLKKALLQSEEKFAALQEYVTDSRLADLTKQREEIALLKKASLQSEEKFSALQEYVNDSRVVDLTNQRKEMALLKKASLQNEEKFSALQKYVNDSRAAELTMKAEFMAEMFLKISTLNQTMRNMIEVVCPMSYENKCTIPVMDVKRNLYQARGKCERMGGNLANVYSMEHFNKIMNFVRDNKIGSNDVVDFHLGMKIVPCTGSASLSDGASDPYLRWDDNFPETDSRYTAMILRVNKNPSATDQYFWNTVPTWKIYTLCEI